MPCQQPLCPGPRLRRKHVQQAPHRQPQHQAPGSPAVQSSRPNLTIPVLSQPGSRRPLRRRGPCRSKASSKRTDQEQEAAGSKTALVLQEPQRPRLGSRQLSQTLSLVAALRLPTRPGRRGRNLHCLQHVVQEWTRVASMIPLLASTVLLLILKSKGMSARMHLDHH